MIQSITIASKIANMTIETMTFRRFLPDRRPRLRVDHDVFPGSNGCFNNKCGFFAKKCCFLQHLTFILATLSELSYHLVEATA